MARPTAGSTLLAEDRPNSLSFRNAEQLCDQEPTRNLSFGTLGMLYELIGIVRAGKIAEVKEITKAAGNTVLSGGGVIRGITNWGVFMLPKPRMKHQTKHTAGHYFILRFDSSAKTQHMVRKTLSLDPRMLRYTVVKMGDKLVDIKDVSGVVGTRKRTYLQES